MPKAIFLSSPSVWARGHGGGHPLKPERLQRTFELLDEYNAFEAPNARLIEPRPPTEEELLYFHTPAYIQAVRALSQGDSSLPGSAYGFGPGDNPVFAEMYASEGLKVGSALLAAELLANDECEAAFSYSGGLHHGGPSFASGFCVFNDIAVAIHWLIRQGLRVAYVDIDVHHGDGVQNAFYESDQVLTISLHQDGRTLFPGTGFVPETGAGLGLGCNVNVPLPPYTGDLAYLEAFHEIVPPLLERFAPEILVTQLGVDTHHLDPLANMALTTHGQLALFESLRDLSPGRWLALGGGGYDISVVPRAWALAFGVMSDQSFSNELPGKYRENYGGQRLHDPMPNLGDEPPGTVSSQVRGIVEQVKKRHRI
jgi:acetoin utilization protein AcuC